MGLPVHQGAPGARTTTSWARQPWQLADANWSPDFPTSAREAIRSTGTSRRTRIDGVIAINTYTIDELLEVTGPITVPDYDVTIAPGETTLKLMQAIWAAADRTQNRKAVLSPFAEQLFSSLLGLPPQSWSSSPATRRPTAGSASCSPGSRTRPPRQRWRLGFDGAVRQDPVTTSTRWTPTLSPVSKLNGVTDRSLDLHVNLDELGNARQRAQRDLDQEIDGRGRPTGSCPRGRTCGTLGMYFRLLVPERSRVEAVAAGRPSALTAPADVRTAGRMVIANYFRIPPGTAHLRYDWTSPYPADLGDDDVFTYRLTIQKQPGLRPGPWRSGSAFRRAPDP